MSPTSPNYYLGRVYDPKTNATTTEQILLDPANLTTHAVVTGMTGSGKTGLCIGLLEEAALHGIPAIIIDPKGDLTNLVLHFPNQLATDFEPWIDPEAARREGKTVSQMALETADRWKKGLAEWDLGPEQLKALATVRITPSIHRGQIQVSRSISFPPSNLLISIGKRTLKCCVSGSPAQSPPCWD